MTELFLNIVNMSVSAGWIVLAVMILRLLLKKAPKWTSVLLWGIVAFRLICPFSIESALSLIPSTQTINPEYALNTPEINSGIPIIDNALNPIIGGATVTVQSQKDLNLFQVIMPYLTAVWLLGILVLLLYTVISYTKLKKRVETAVLLKDNIYQSENVIFPFVLGIIRPKIYLPFGLDESGTEHVIAHEKAHIKRCDHLIKPLGFLLLTIHWFNPLIWVGYILLCKDIELACDEKVIKALNTSQRADYSQALLSCSINRRMIAACPIAFGEVSVKSRIKTVLNYKRPAFWIIIIAVIVSITAAICFLTDPIKKTETDDIHSSIDAERITWSYRPMLSFTGHYAKAFFFDFDYTHVDTACTGGKMWDFEADGQPRDTAMKFEKGKNVYWTPNDEIDDIPQKSEVTLKVYDDKKQIYKCTVIFECVEKNVSASEFEIYFKNADGLNMVSSDGKILLTENAALNSSDPKLPKIKEIEDKTVTESLPTDQALQPFYADEKYIYSFPSIKSDYVIVKFDNGSEMTVKNALEQGLITVSSLDDWNIKYYKKER